MKLPESTAHFDPNSPARQDANLFGLPFSTENARCVVVPVPWEVTVSYGGGTVEGPEAIRAASLQVDLYDPDFPDAWKIGVAMDDLPTGLKRLSKALRRRVEPYLNAIGQGRNPQADRALNATRESIDAGCRSMVDHVRATTARFLDEGKMVALIGGDHSTPLGFMEALAGRFPAFGILQIDAHADLRDSYEGFAFSHASIMFNALKLKPVKRLVQVGIRDYCDEEARVIRSSRGRVVTFYDRDIKQQVYQGRTIAALHKRMVKDLPDHVYISLDIDGLDPKLCPHTGTPVPGGLEFEEVLHLIRTVVASGKRIIGFDINEVSPRADEWDANVGARLLFRMINLMARSQGVSVTQRARPFSRKKH